MGRNLDMIITSICKKGPVETYNEMLERDEGFKEFVKNNKNKSRSEMIEEFELKIYLGE